MLLCYKMCPWLPFGNHQHSGYGDCSFDGDGNRNMITRTLYDRGYT